LVLLAVLAVLALILYACSDSGSGKKKPSGNGKNTASASQTSIPTAGGSSVQGSSGGATSVSGGASGSAPGSHSGGPSNSAGAPSGLTGGPGGTGGTTSGSTGGVTAGAIGGTGGVSGGPGTTGGPGAGSSTAAGCQLNLVLSSQSGQYANGDQPAFTVTAINKGTADCDVDLGPKSLVLNIFSGPERIWSSADCGSGDKDLRGIAPGSAQTVTYTWNRLRSSAGCPAGGQPAKLGTYFGVVSLAAGPGPTAPAAQSQPKTFELKSGS
jgi:hypothetical protein